MCSDHIIQDPYYPIRRFGVNTNQYPHPILIFHSQLLPYNIRHLPVWTVVSNAKTKCGKRARTLSPLSGAGASESHKSTRDDIVRRARSTLLLFCMELAIRFLELYFFLSIF